MAAGGAAITAFYMFRLWYLTFAGEPRDHHVYDHAHESPRIMYMPLVVLALFAVFVGGELARPGRAESAGAGPAGRHAGHASVGKLLTDLHYPSEHDVHLAENRVAHDGRVGGVRHGAWPASCWRRCCMPGGFWTRPRWPSSSAAIYLFLLHKWYFDELYDAIFVQPVMFISRRVAQFDKDVIDRFIDSLAYGVRRIACARRSDRSLFGRWAGQLDRPPDVCPGAELARRAETGKLRQYVMFIVVGTVALFVLISVLVF